MHIIDVTEPGPLLDSVYSDVLAPSFDPAELESLDSLRAGITAGTSRVGVILNDDGAPVAATVVDWSPDSRVLLLSYLAVNKDLRGGGHGSALLTHVQRHWFTEFGAYALLAEVEHPAAHASSATYGDPAARMRFYARHGGYALDVPYFQPALRENDERVYGVILIVLAVEGDALHPAHQYPNRIAGEPVRRFMEGYVEATEGPDRSDPALTALWAGLGRPDGVPLIPLDEPNRIPLSTKDGPRSSTDTV